MRGLPDAGSVTIDGSLTAYVAPSEGTAFARIQRDESADAFSGGYPSKQPNLAISNGATMNPLTLD